jgi:DNA recombination protein RmuC
LNETTWVAAIAAVVGFLLGGLIALIVLRARQAVAIQRATSGIAVELATTRERANRVLSLEAELAAKAHAEKTLQQDLLRLATLEAEKGQQLRSAEEQLRDLNARLARSDELAASCSAELTALKQRAAALEAEASRVPGLEAGMEQAEQANVALAREISVLKESLGRMSAELKAERDVSTAAQRELDSARAELTSLRESVAHLSVEKMDLATRLEAERQQAAEKLQLLNEAKQALSDQFKALANDILEEKSKRFAEQNQTNLGQLLDPLKTKLTEFQTKVETVYVTESKDRVALREQVHQLIALNQALTSEAKNLTQALKGSSKTQGNYGELVLERVLESSGLRKGEEYETQASHTREDGSRAQPDVIIRLPEHRNLIVDSKLSLVAYEESVTAESEDAREAAIARHIASVRAHIKGLSEKNYQALYQLKSLDFVLMFVPIEPAFMLAVTHDRDLFMEAWSKNVLLVSPSTLMFVVRTVAHLWRQEAQSRNAQEIAKRGAELYDKLVGFVADLEKLGDRLRLAQDSFNAARDKLAKGRGNVIRQAEMLKDLGVKPNKAMPAPLVDMAVDADENLGEPVSHTLIEDLVPLTRQ